MSTTVITISVTDPDPVMLASMYELYQELVDGGFQTSFSAVPLSVLDQ